MRQATRTALALLLVSSILILAVPHRTSAIPYKIEGYLKDSRGLPIPMANISISGRYYNSSAQGFQTETYYVTSDSAGYFRLHIAAMEPGGFDTGTEMMVSYRSEGVTVSKTITIQGLGAWANLTYEEKPNLVDAITSPLGIITLVLISTAIFVAYYLYHAGDKEKTQQTEDAPKRVERRRRQR
jgi:hypothetical protein